MLREMRLNAGKEQHKRGTQTKISSFFENSFHNTKNT
jgi:hypothetical protein